MNSKIEKLIEGRATTGVFTDFFDEKKLPYTFLPNLKPNNETFFAMGRVRTVVCEEGDFEDENINLGLGYLDKIDARDILVVLGSRNFAYFGELMSKLSKKRNLSGAIILGATRDSRFTSDIFPVWSLDSFPIDIKGRGRVKSVGKPFHYMESEISESLFCCADADGVLLFDIDYVAYFREIADILLKEQEIIELIDQNETVETILKNTKSF